MSTGAEKDPWVPVRDESELREGMAVQLRNCLQCGRRETIWLGQEEPPTMYAISRDGTREINTSRRAFKTVGRCEGPRDVIAIGYSVRAGMLFRLADSQLADPSETTTATRERERSLAGGRR